MWVLPEVDMVFCLVIQRRREQGDLELTIWLGQCGGVNVERCTSILSNLSTPLWTFRPQNVFELWTAVGWFLVVNKQVSLNHRRLLTFCVGNFMKGDGEVFTRP